MPKCTRLSLRLSLGLNVTCTISSESLGPRLCTCISSIYLKVQKRMHTMHSLVLKHSFLPLFYNQRFLAYLIDSTDSQLISSRDPAVRYSATQKTSSEQQKHRVELKPMVVTRDALDPGMSGKKLSKVTRTVMENDSEERHSPMLASERRGEALHVAEGEVASQWASALDTLIPFELKFALNACQDTLPHNVNLALWKGHLCECKLCGERQTLLHILCNCPVALKLRWYNTRHDEVLRVIYNLLKEHPHFNQSIIADLHDLTLYVFAPHIAKTDLRPDIVVWNDMTRSITLLELMACHESNLLKHINKR